MTRTMAARQIDLSQQTEALRARLAEAEEALRAIQHGEIDALVVEGSGGRQVYTLHSADEPYRNLVEQMHEGAVVFTPDGDVLYANARFAALVGEPLESIVGSRIHRFIAPADQPGFELLRAAGSGRRRGSIASAHAGAVAVSLSLITTPSIHGDRLNLIVTDLSELLAANSHRDQAERDNRTKDEFLAMLAHELRTPLGAITSAVKVIEVTNTQGGPVARAHDVIARQIAHVSHLINDLLDVEQIVSGKTRLDREVLDLAATVRNAAAGFAADGRFVWDLSDTPLWVNVDPVRLQQVLTNVLNNAVKYTPTGGRIRVALHPDNGDAVLIVEDTGLGISPKLLPRIFDLYVQADHTLDHAQGGLGIGLTLVRRLIELHGGTIVAESAGEGHGSRFTIRLAQASAAGQAAAIAAPPERTIRPRRVLLIEDNDDAREMLRMMLELDGHEVFDAADGPSGLKLLKTARPEIGIIDINLPRMDGYQIAQRIRKDPHGGGMLLFALTGYDAPTDPAHSLQCGFDRHLVKPIDPDYLARLLSEGGGSPGS